MATQIGSKKIVPDIAHTFGKGEAKTGNVTANTSRKANFFILFLIPIACSYFSDGLYYEKLKYNYTI
jgi:hypothetical protein